jgi:GH35 family endo-1,4-beta-xylanase
MPTRYAATIAATLLFLFAQIATAQSQTAPRELLTGADIGAKEWIYVGADRGALKNEIEPCDLPGHPKAVKLTVVTPSPDQYWTLQLAQEQTHALPVNSVLRLKFWARSATSNVIAAVFEHNADPYEKFLEQTLTLRPTWTEYALVFTVPRPIPEHWSGVRFQLGFKAGEIELTGLSLEDWGVNPNPPPKAIGGTQDPFGGIEAKPGWQEEAEKRIDRIRRGNLLIRVVDGHGQPVQGAVVKVAQQTTKFRFGTALAATPLFDPGPDGQKYRAIVLKLFNAAVMENELKWQSEDWVPAGTADKMLAWCHQNGLSVRGHNLLWPSYKYLPKSVTDLRGDALRDAIHKHITDYVSQHRGEVYVWDVINEAVTNTEVTQSVGPGILVDAYKWAREADPNVLLAYNDFAILNNRAGANDGHKEAAAMVIRRLLDAGAPVTSLGIQGHMSLPLTHGDRLLDILDEWAKFGLPLEITEYDAAIKDDALHAAYLREFLTAVYSHPAVTSFLMWGFWEGAHWLAAQGGAMYHKDWTPRPSVAVYEELVLKKWRTNVTLRSNRLGMAKTRAYLGDLMVQATYGGRTSSATVTVDKAGDEISEITVVL